MASIKSESDGTIRVISIQVGEGRLHKDVAIQEVAAQMYVSLANAPERKVLLDFTPLVVVSSAFLGVMIKIAMICERSGIWLKISGCPVEFEEALVIAKLSRVLDCHRDAAEAIAAFKAERRADPEGRRRDGPDDDGPDDAGVFARLKPRPSGGTTAREREADEE